MPNFAWFDEDTEHSDVATVRATAIAKKITQLQTEIEQRGFVLAASDGWNENTVDALQAERDLDLELLYAKLEAIGACMMRPYEYWNEDERHMQYMDSCYDY